ncbi:hypothetical protein MOR33_004815 [Salmonella enterica]|nr:hypothetical protein [Salmonella enterica]EGL7479618.1 hypothetical protein [Salmonella enterica]EIZ2335780.1 hypothetical protein [Salmonella enterica]
MADLRDLSRQLKQTSKQTPFALSRALTETARKIEQAEKKTLQRKLESPTPFTVNSVSSKGATKSHLVAKVFVMDKAEKYLEPFEFGGVHHLNSKALLNPKDIRLNKYGNIAKNRLGVLRSRPDVFIGKIKSEAGDIGGVFQRRKYQKVKKREKRSKNGTRRARIKQRPPKLLIRFGDALPVKPVLGYMDRANAMASALLSSEMSKAMAEAMRTAK